MKIQGACFVVLTAVACGGTGETSALDAGGSRDSTLSDVTGLPDSVVSTSRDGAPFTDASHLSAVADGAAADAVTEAAAAATLGGSCIPGEEETSQFPGFSVHTVAIETTNPMCASHVCLINHFQGRVTCPYGQSATGQGPGGAAGCTVPETGDPVAVEVPAQLTCRIAAETVYCSCRCANDEGKTDDGAAYCTCPGAMMCVQLVSSIGDAGVGIAGAYCVKAGTEFDGGVCSTTCDPTTSRCP